MENKIISMENAQRENLNEIRIKLYDTMRDILVEYLRMAAEHKYGYKANEVIVSKCLNNIKKDNNSYIYKAFVDSTSNDKSIYNNMDVTIAAALLRFAFKDFMPGKCCFELYNDLIRNITEDRNALIGHYTSMSIEEAEERIIRAFDHLMDFLSFILSITSLEKQLLSEGSINKGFLKKEERYVEYMYIYDMKPLAEKIENSFQGFYDPNKTLHTVYYIELKNNYDYSMILQRYRDVYETELKKYIKEHDPKYLIKKEDPKVTKDLDTLRFCIDDFAREILVEYIKLTSQHVFKEKAEQVIKRKCMYNYTNGIRKNIYVNFINNQSRQNVFDRIDISLACSLLKYDFDEFSPFLCGKNMFIKNLDDIKNDRNVLIAHYTFKSNETTAKQILDAFNHLLYFASYIKVSAICYTSIIENDKFQDQLRLFGENIKNKAFDDLGGKIINTIYKNIAIPPKTSFFYKDENGNVTAEEPTRIDSFYFDALRYNYEEAKRISVEKKEKKKQRKELQRKREAEEKKQQAEQKARIKKDKREQRIKKITWRIRYGISFILTILMCLIPLLLWVFFAFGMFK